MPEVVRILVGLTHRRQVVTHALPDQQQFATDRAVALLDDGAKRQRPLCASTGVKDPSLPDTLYVTELVAPGVVNTMPEKTLEAVADHGVVEGDTVTGAYAEAGRVLDALDQRVSAGASA